jgi:hypothetical protein
MVEDGECVLELGAEAIVEGDAEVVGLQRAAGEAIHPFARRE